MKNKVTEIMARAGAELVPTPRARLARVPAPGLRHRPAVHPARAWLRELLSPPPRSYLAAGERYRIATHLHWVVPLRAMTRAAGAMSLAGLLTMALAVLAPAVLRKHSAPIEYCIGLRPTAQCPALTHQKCARRCGR